MPELDHLIFASPDLDQGVAYIESLTGVRAAPGGPHPGVGSHNALLTFDDVTYFEVIAIDPGQPTPQNPRPFGLDDGLGPRLAGYAIHPSTGETAEQLVALMASLGHDTGGLASMSRVKPDGEEISWRLTHGDVASRAGGFLPFIIEWGDTPTPARSQPKMGDLEAFRVQHPDAELRAVIEGLGLPIEVSEGEPLLTAVVNTPRGTVEISSAGIG